MRKTNYKMSILDKIVKLINDEKERISWDEYFLSISLLISHRSPCHRLNVGSVIVKDNRIISAGYNGYLPGAPHISRIRDNHEMGTVHSEINTITDCAKRGISVEGCTIYITHYPCIHCFKAIIACGIKKIIYHSDYNNDLLVKELADENGTIILQL